VHRCIKYKTVQVYDISFSFSVVGVQKAGQIVRELINLEL